MNVFEWLGGGSFERFRGSMYSRGVGGGIFEECRDESIRGVVD